jgi:hypothetical protein
MLEWIDSEACLLVGGCLMPARGVVTRRSWSFLSLSIVLLSSGCMIPAMVHVRPVELPGWREKYTFLNPDGTRHDGGYFVVEYSEQPGMAAREWGIRGSKNELYVIPIIDGQATLPRKAVWKSIWAWGVDGLWHPDSLTTTYVLAPGMDPYRSGPGRWHHGFEVGAKWPPDSQYARFDCLPRDERLTCRLQRAPEPNEAHRALLDRLARANETFRGYQTFGLDGRELDVIREFGERSLREAP